MAAKAPLRELILDVETTGLERREGHRVIEIALLEMIDKKLTGRRFHTYLNPERDVPADAFAIHGLSGDMLLDKPLFATIAQEMLTFIGKESKFVSHNAPFDFKFLNHELQMALLPLLQQSAFVDTLPIARRRMPGEKVNLSALCSRLKIDNSATSVHGALRDALLLAEVYTVIREN